MSPNAEIYLNFMENSARDIPPRALKFPMHVSNFFELFR